jgi:alkanesulfonate monooxygenase SsuD/methylene tetrahydromethanopterin reductase-like flavin-dependent oxidoreductase (luciferase family)
MSSKEERVPHVTLQFGILVPQGWTMDLAGIKDPVQAYETMTKVAQIAEEMGFASVWLVDHFHTIPHPTPEVTFECWMSTAALARDTRNIRIGQMVTCNSYRHTALLAKMASTVDVLSHGRLNVGIGAGWDEQDIAPMAMPILTAQSACVSCARQFRSCWGCGPRRRHTSRVPIIRCVVLLTSPKA